MRRVVVTGIGALTPIGNNVNEYAEGLKLGKSGAANITHFDATSFKTHFACEVKDIDIQQFIEAREVRRLDKFTQYALVVAEEAMKDSGLDLEAIDLDRIGVIWGSGIGGLRSLEQEIEENTNAEIPRYNPFMIPKMIADIAPGHISIKYGLRGVNFGTVSACASATHAFITALDNIRLGRADIIVSGGSEAAVTRAGIGGFGSMKALSQRNDDPSTASRPFDKDRDGFVLGEGAGCLILEEYEHAKKRGAKIYAELSGGGMTADAYHITAPHPEGMGASQVMRLTLADAQLNPEEIDYINVHGTSTPLGDVAELKAISTVFGDHAFDLNISSTKSMTGHLLGASGAVEAVAAILAMQDGFIPPTINHFSNDPDIDSRFNLTFNEAQEKTLNIVLSNTFGFGGHNACVIFKKL
ncbi:MAG: beta-ketoacyl-ACP synthase II [Saprospiraceae bacterium]|nr:beta-ketoacyl-ACP synthase II [Saprospiraceae bacterium]